MFTVVVTFPDGRVYELTPVQSSMRYTSAAVGGFGSASFTLEGDRRTSVPFFATIRVLVGMSVAWEGRVEDVVLNLNDPVTTSVSCFGFQRLLTDTSVRRIWSIRSLSFSEFPGGLGTVEPLNLSGGISKGNVQVSTGAYDPTNAANQGVRVAGNGVALAGATGDLAYATPGRGLTLQRILCTVTLTGANTGATKMFGRLFGWNYGSTAALDFADFTASGAASVAISSRDTVGFGASTGGAVTPTATDTVDFSDIRVLGTSLTEDTTDGFYGDSILRDLIALVPALGQGIIESGTDFTIPSIERSVRDTIASVVAEVAGYYTREWAVWDSPTGVPVFSWTTPNLDEPQWIVTLDKMLAGSRIESSIDTLARTAYVLYTLAGDVTGTTSEQNASSTDQRNPAVKTSATKDTIVQAPAVMTDNTASALAAVEAAKQLYPPASGTIVLRAADLIQNVVGSPRPAALIRAGTNVFLPDLVRSDSLITPPQRDGQTLFHIASTEVDMEAGTVTLELEGQAREIDVITARLAAATRVVTG